MRHAPLLTLALCFACGGSPPPPAQTPEVTETAQAAVSLPSGDLAAVLAGAHRTDEERARDSFRNPRATLEFFGLTPAMTVVEIWPGRGWYTKVLAPYLRGDGKLIVANFDPNTEGYRGELVAGLRAMFDEQPTIYDQVQVVGLYPGNLMEDVPDATVDLVLLPRTIHNWVRNEDEDREGYFRAIARVLRPGGVLGVVQHRAPEGHPEAETGNDGYLSEAFVIRMVEAAGLKLDERSEINANPNDTHEHPDGVWSLPPVLRGPEEGHARHEAIGESDRMTLRFIKPAADDDDDDDDIDESDDDDDIDEDDD